MPSTGFRTRFPTFYFCSRRVPRLLWPDFVCAFCRSVPAYLHNLLENTIQAPGAAVEARMRRDGGRLCFSVLDRGPWIAEADRPHVTERFYLGAASPSDEGSGLGLSIALAAARAMGGELRLQPGPGGRRARGPSPAGRASGQGVHTGRAGLRP